MKRPAIEVRDLGKRYLIRQQKADYLSLREEIVKRLRFTQQDEEDFWALREVSFDVQQGESLGIVGRNGAGKSTLLKILSKITSPTKGSIRFQGRIASLLEVGTGFHPELTGRENIFFNGSLLGMRRQEISRKFDEMVYFSGTERFLDTPLKFYSSGMQLRLAFSVAAFLEPEILVIDEVLAVGDAEFQKKCIGKMQDIGASGRTILFVSHNLSAVAQLCQRSVLLDEGRLKLMGDTSDVIRTYLENGKSTRPDEDIQVAPGLFLRNISFLLSEGEGRVQFTFSFLIEQSSINVVSDLALLFFNEFNERVAILDLRHQGLFQLSSSAPAFTVNGTVEHLPMVEGNYQIGIYVASNLFHGNHYHIGQLDVPPVPREILPYPVRDRGHIELKAKFEINT